MMKRGNGKWLLKGSLIVSLGSHSRLNEPKKSKYGDGKKDESNPDIPSEISNNPPLSIAGQNGQEKDGKS